MRSQIIPASVLSSVLLSGAVGLGCAPEVSIELEPTPAAEAVTRGDYRWTSFANAAPDTGRDLDGDTTPDNHFPYFLDYASEVLYSALLPLLVEELGEDQAEQALQVLEQVLQVSGLPASAAAYDQAMAEAVLEGRINFLSSLQTEDASLLCVVSSGAASPSGYQVQADLSQLEGQAGNPARVRGEVFGLLYAQEWFNLPVYRAELAFTWNSRGIHDGQLTGAVALEDVVVALLSLVPESLVVGDEVIEIPVAALEAALHSTLLDVQLEDGSYLVDLRGSDPDAISAAFGLEGSPVLLVQ